MGSTLLLAVFLVASKSPNRRLHAPAPRRRHERARLADLQFGVPSLGLLLLMALVVRAGAGRPPLLPASARPAVDLVASRPISLPERDRRRKALDVFAAWLLDSRRTPLEEALEGSAEAMARALAAFGQQLYNTGGAVASVTYAILAVVDRRREWRHRMQLPWDVVRFWQDLMPLYSHRPFPLPLVLAFAAQAAVWQWLDVVILLLVGFAAMLRPAELFALKVRNILFSEDLGVAGLFFFVVVESPKARRKGARMQHVRVDDPFIYWILRSVCKHLAPAQKLFAGTNRKANQLFAALAQQLGVSTRDGTGLTWASLRGGGATNMYLAGRPREQIQWAGRWRSALTLDTYIQEVAAMSLMTELHPDSRALVDYLAGNSHSLLSSSVARWAHQVARGGSAAGGCRGAS